MKRQAYFLILLGMTLALGLLACGDTKEAIRVYVTPTLDESGQPVIVYVTPTAEGVAQAPPPKAVSYQHTITPPPTPQILPGVTFGPITGPNYTPEPLHTALPPVVTTRPCPAIVTVPEVTLRAAPDPNAEPVTTAFERNKLIVSALQTDANGNTWANTPHGWLPLSDGDTLLAQLDSMRACEILLGREKPTTLLGLHVLGYTRQPEILNFVGRMAQSGHPLSTVKGLSGSEETLTQVKAISPDTVIVYRSLDTPDGWGDCPQELFDGKFDNPEEVARRWVEGLQPYWSQVQADYYELMNECPAPLDWIARFSIEAMRLANERGQCLLLFSFPGGNPDMVAFEQLLPAYQYALDNPCASGLQHGVALHAYSMEDDRLVSESDVWIAFRHRILYERLLLALPEAANLPVYITELGIGGGTMMPSCDMIVRDALQYTYQLEEDPYVKGFHLWNVGTGAQWYDISPCFDRLANALITYYSP